MVVYLACWPRQNHLYLAKRAGYRRLRLLGQAQCLVLGCLVIERRHPCSPVIAVEVAMAIAIGDAGRHGEGGAGRERQFGYCLSIIDIMIITIAT